MYKNLVKKLIDVGLGVLLSTMTLPIVLILIVLIKLESRGPGIFKQKRIGLHSDEFIIYKLRSMHENQTETNTYFTSVNDSRITRVGRIIRKTSLDELPQLWNLAKGEMSLIGPRPNVPAQISLYSEHEWRLRNSIRPGITGLSQATFRSQGTESMRKKLDLFYVRKMSFCLDIVIVYRTFMILVKKGVQN